MYDEADRSRRSFVGTASLAVAAAKLAMTGPANAQPSKAKPIKPGANKSFPSLKQIDAGVLSVGYAEAGRVAPDIEGAQPVERQNKLARYLSGYRSRTTR